LGSGHHGRKPHEKMSHWALARQNTLPTGRDPWWSSSPFLGPIFRSARIFQSGRFSLRLRAPAATVKLQRDASFVCGWRKIAGGQSPENGIGRMRCSRCPWWMLPSRCAPAGAQVGPLPKGGCPRFGLGFATILPWPGPSRFPIVPAVPVLVRPLHHRGVLGSPASTLVLPIPPSPIARSADQYVFGHSAGRSSRLHRGRTLRARSLACWS